MVIPTFSPFTGTNIGSLTRVSPFTHRDNSTFLRILQELVQFINETLRPEMDTELERILNEFQTALDAAEANFDGKQQEWIALFNSMIADLQGQIAVLNDAAVAGLIDDAASLVSAALKHPVIDVRRYGATGDGVTDDTAFIQAAIDDAYTGKIKTVLFPEGTYNVLSRVRLRPGLTYLAYGATFTKTSTAMGYAVFYSGSDGNKGYGSGDSNMRWAGGTFKGSFADMRGVCGFALHHTDNMVVTDVRFTECMITGHVADLMGCSNITFDRITVEGFFNQGGGWNKEEAIQCDQSSAGSGSAPDLPSSYDGLGCKGISVINSLFLPLTIGGTKYPAPNPFGSHANGENSLTRNARFNNNYILDPVLDQTSDMRGTLHFLGVDGIEVHDNTVEFSVGSETNQLFLGLYSTDQGVPHTGANYEGGNNVVTTLANPLKVKNVSVKRNKLKRYTNANGLSSKGTITIDGHFATVGFPVFENVIIEDNDFEMLNTGTGICNTLYLRYGKNARVRGNTFIGPVRALDVTNVDDLDVGPNLSRGTRADGWRVSGGDNIMFNGVKARECVGTGIYIIGSTRVMVRHNLIDSPDISRAVAINNVVGFIVAGNDIRAILGTRGVQVYGTSANGKVHSNIIGGGTATHVEIIGMPATVTETDNLKLTS